MGKSPVKLASLPACGRYGPSSDWLIDHGYGSECGMRPDYDCDACAAAGTGRACDQHRIPGIGLSTRPCPQEVAYVEVMGHQPPTLDPATAAQFDYKPTGRKADRVARALALASARTALPVAA